MNQVLANKNDHGFQTDLLIQQIVGNTYPVNPQASIIEKIGYFISDFFDAIADLFAGIIGRSETDIAQKKMHQEFKDLVHACNTDLVSTSSLPIKTLVESFFAQAKKLDPSLTAASLFQKTMILLSTARRNPIEILDPEKVKPLTEEINALLGIKTVAIETKSEAMVTSPFKKVAFVIACFATVALASYAISRLLTNSQMPSPSLSPEDSFDVWSGLTKGKCPAVINITPNLTPSLRISESNSCILSDDGIRCLLPLTPKRGIIENGLAQWNEHLTIPKEISNADEVLSTIQQNPWLLGIVPVAWWGIKEGVKLYKHIKKITIEVAGGSTATSPSPSPSPARGSHGLRKENERPLIPDEGSTTAESNTASSPPPLTDGKTENGLRKENERPLIPDEGSTTAGAKTENSPSP